MAKDNGGVIGVLNTPTTSLASGVWMLMSEYQARVSGTWPFPFNLGSSSLRFNSGSSDNLTFTPSSSSNRRTFTLSTWVKRSKLGALTQIFGASSTAYDAIGFDANDKLRIYIFNNAISTIRVSTQVFRDVSAWYHIVVAFDTTNATAQNRCRVYINGTEITTWDTNNTVTQNLDTSFNQNVIQYIGRYGYSVDPEYFNGYLAEVYSINGSQLTPSSFGQTDSTTGIWTPIAYTGTYGTNGFYLNFSNSASLGTDSSGNGNNWTVNNLTSVDQSKDHPTNNFATMNPLGNFYPASTFSEGNLKMVTSGSASTWSYNLATIGVSNGKWYWETKVTKTSVMSIGIASSFSNSATSEFGVGTADGYAYVSNGNVYNNGSAILSSIGTYTTGDIIGIALDVTNNKLYFSKNGTFINSGNPASGTNGISITAPSSFTSGNYFPAFGDDDTASETFEMNFGSAPYTVSGGYSDANGYGNFTYQPPSGYFALCTNNLASNG